MKLLDYQKRAIKNRIYDQSVAFPYILLGLCGEVSELIEKMINYSGTRDCQRLLSKEVGDIYWYIAAWCEENQIDINSIEKLNAVDKNNEQQIIFRLILCSGEIAEIGKKALRDDFEESISKNVFPEQKLSAININLSILLHLLKLVENHYGIFRADVLDQNIEKIEKRKQDNVIQGSGDER